MGYRDDQLNDFLENGKRCDSIDLDNEPLVSNCCGATGFEYEDMGICPECLEHCEFIVLGSDE